MTMTPGQKARKVAELVVESAIEEARMGTNWCDAGREVFYTRITTALLQFAQEQESEAVRELVAGLEPFAQSVGNEIRWTENNTDQFFYNFIETGHCRNAAALIAKHSRKGV